MLHQSQKPIDINEVFKYFPNELFWYFIIDQQYWPSQNPKIFDEDRSKNYYVNASAGLFISLLMVDLPLTIDRISGLHDIGYHHKKSGLGMKAHGISGFDSTSFTRDGLIELIDKIRIDKVKLSFAYQLVDKKEKIDILLDANKSSEGLASEILEILKDEKALAWTGLMRLTSLADVLEVSQHYIDRYNNEIKSAGDDKEKKLTAIVRFIQDMHQYHPFEDGNGRVFIFFLLNVLLIKNNLDPSFVNDPGHFTGWSVKELVKEVENGQITFKNLLKGSSNKISILDYIRDQLKIDKDKELNLRAQFDIGELNKSEDGKIYLGKNLDLIYSNILPKLQDHKTIDLIFNEHKPSTAINLLKTVSNCAIYQNDYLLIKLINFFHDNKNSRETMKAPEVLELIFRNFEFETIKLLFEGGRMGGENFLGLEKLLHLTSDDFLVPLLNNQSKLANGQKHFFLRNLIVTGNDKLFEFLLKKLDLEDLKLILNLDMHGINGMQLIALFKPDLISYCLEKIKPQKIKSLLAEKVTTISDFEYNKLQEVSLFDVADNLMSYKTSQSGLQQHGLYAEKKEKQEKKENVDLDKTIKP